MSSIINAGIGTKGFVKVFHDRMFDIKMWIQALKLNCGKRLRCNIVSAVPKLTVWAVWTLKLIRPNSEQDVASTAAASFFLGGHKEENIIYGTIHLWRVLEMEVAGLKTCFLFVDSIVFKQ